MSANEVGGEVAQRPSTAKRINARERRAVNLGFEAGWDAHVSYLRTRADHEPHPADAWDEGYLRGTLDATSDLEPADNPYRYDETAASSGAGA